MEYTQWDDLGIIKQVRDYRFVLILVVMEYTQWDYGNSEIRENEHVLILVVMEYTQWERQLCSMHLSKFVLILVVMEYTQWVPTDETEPTSTLSLNPCCNGIYSMSSKAKLQRVVYYISLNPCCNGIYSMSMIAWAKTKRLYQS